MASDKKKRGMWMGHPLISPEHEHDLHLAAALHEFEGGMPREEAEKRALDDYRNEHHARAAAHHYAGMKAGHATGNMEDAKKHHALYSLHVKALGEDPMGPVPTAVRKYYGSAGDQKQPHTYRFHGHDADDYLVQPVTKHELELVDLKKAATPLDALKAAAAQVASWCDLGEYFEELAKGDVVDLKTGQTIAPVQRMPEDWVPQRETCMNNHDCPGGNSKYAAETAPGYSMCPDCLNRLHRALGKPPYDPQEHVKQGFSSPVEMLRARIAGLFNPELGGRRGPVSAGPGEGRGPLAKPDVRQRMKMPVEGGGQTTAPRAGHLSVVKKEYDATPPNDPMRQQDREIAEEVKRTGAPINDALLAISKRKNPELHKALTGLKSTLDILQSAKAVLAELEKKK